jgi:hypothetical protein
LLGSTIAYVGEVAPIFIYDQSHSSASVLEVAYTVTRCASWLDWCTGIRLSRGLIRPWTNIVSDLVQLYRLSVRSPGITGDARRQDPRLDRLFV